MGASQSGGVEIGGSSMGYQVLRVYPDSPGSRAGLKAYFDFIVAIGQSRFVKEDGSLREILKASVDQKLKMIVFNTRSKQAREVEIVPTTTWGGNGLLGVSIKHSSFDRADERVWHVVEVDPGSPAHQAGFKAGEDYVIGSDSILQENDDLYNLIETHEGKALKLFVYNSKTDNCREVICHPNSKWGGRGYLGCEFGYGLLHRIPYAEDQAHGLTTTSSTTMATKPAAEPYKGNPSVGDPGRNLLMQQSSRQQQQLPLQQLPQLPLSSPLDTRDQMMRQQQQQQPQRVSPAQPGNQMFQQALLSNTSAVEQQQQQKPTNQPSSQTPPVAQTFAQLADAQYQQDLLEKQRHQQQQNQYQKQQPMQQPNLATPMQSPLINQQQQQQQVPIQSNMFANQNVPAQYQVPSTTQPGNQLFQQALFGETGRQTYELLPPLTSQASGQQQLQLPSQAEQSQPAPAALGPPPMAPAAPPAPPPAPPSSSVAPSQAPQTFAQLASHPYQLVQEAPISPPLSQQQQQQPSSQQVAMQQQQQQAGSYYPSTDVNFH